MQPKLEKESGVQSELDGQVINIELTLISIIQGVALSFLTNTAYPLVLEMRFALWPYIATGLVTIFIFWSRSITHTLTVIRWPLEFIHNFIYIACTLVEGIAFIQIGNIGNWFALNSLLAGMVWLLFLFDLKIIRRRIQDSAGPSANRLYSLVAQEQKNNILIWVPATFLFNLAAWLAVRHWPDIFLQDGWHLLLGALQLVTALGYLWAGVRFFSRLAPFIGRTREEWMDDELISLPPERS